MSRSLGLEDVERALRLPDVDGPEAQRRMAPRPRTLYRPVDNPGDPRQAGVLILLYPLDSHLTFVLTRRTDTLANHRGQISLPGGSRHAGETMAETAVREACEELRISLDGRRVLGRLAPLYIPPSDFEIHPFVSYCPVRPEVSPEPAEVAELLEVPLARLLEPAAHRQETWAIRGVDVRVPFYQLCGHKVWGATAMVLSELEQRLRIALDQDLRPLGAEVAG